MRNGGTPDDVGGTRTDDAGKITTPRISRRCGFSSKSPFLRYAYSLPWLDVLCPTRRFASSLA